MTGTSPGREALDLLADVIRGRRAWTQIKILQRTAEMLREAGLSAHVVPDKTLVPLLEFSGLEELGDDAMIDRWASLLANAATTDTPDVPPSFPDILRQLEPAEARTLDQLVADDGRAVEIDAIGLNLPARQIDNLERLGLLRSLPEVSAEDVLLGTVPQPPVQHLLAVTQLAVAFVLACRQPRARYT